MYSSKERRCVCYPDFLIFIRQDPTKAGDLYNLAAESAMACMKGKLANKYYMLAEEAYSLLADED